MNIYRIWQTVNRGYDTFSSAIITQWSVERAKHIHPQSQQEWDLKDDTDKPSDSMHRWDGAEWICDDDAYNGNNNWCAPADVNVELIGETADPEAEAGIILCASYHAG